MKKCFGSCESCQHQMCARRVPIFSTLDTEELNKIVSLIIRREYDRGEMVVMEGDHLENLVIINHGQIKAFKNTLEGKEQILYIFTEGDFFGENNLLLEQESPYYIEALEKTNVCMINKMDFQSLLRKYPDIGIKIISELSNRLEKLENTILMMGTKSVEARVSAVILEFAWKYGKTHEKGIEIDLPLSREGIANYIGLTRETVSRKMSLLQEERIIEMVGNKKIILLDKQALEASME